VVGIKRYHAIMSKKSKKPTLADQSMSSQISSILKSKLITDYVNSSEGKKKLAQSMVQPLRTKLDYASMARRIFVEVICEICGKKTVEGANAGCPHCITRDVIES
jgi:rubrerythrin